MSRKSLFAYLGTLIAFLLLDGLWLAWCLNPAAFRPEDGIALCRNWIEGLRRGAYAEQER